MIAGKGRQQSKARLAGLIEVDRCPVHHTRDPPTPRFFKNTPADTGQNVDANRWNSDLTDGVFYGERLLVNPVVSKRRAKASQRRKHSSGITGGVPCPDIRILCEAGLRVSHRGIAANDRILNQAVV